MKKIRLFFIRLLLATITGNCLYSALLAASDDPVIIDDGNSSTSCPENIETTPYEQQSIKIENAWVSEQDIIMVLYPELWLSDTVLNACIHLINQDSYVLLKKPPRKTSILVTDFYQTVRADINCQMKQGTPFNVQKYKGWLKKQNLNLKTLHNLLIPVGTKNHWLVANINVLNQQIEIYNSNLD